MASSHPLNQIFFGPPGTGKTYHTIDRAVAVVEGLSEQSFREQYPPEARERLRRQFERYKETGQIAFVTFHQSFGYEDFVEGLRPRRSEQGGLTYEVEDGIFKQLCTEATYALYVAQHRPARTITTRERRTNRDFNALYFDFMVDLKQRMQSHVTPPIFTTRSGSEVMLTGITGNNNLSVRHTRGNRTYVVSKGRLRRLYERFAHPDEIQNITTDILETIGGCNTSVYWAVFRALKEFEQPFDSYVLEKEALYEEELLSDPDYDTKRRTIADFDYASLTELDRRWADRYVLIIDEINRGNVAGIFGELITLIEPDKRGGNAEALSVELPYSKDRFTVPPNLYLIGTMNTADRSIEALDTALRRRFHFVEMPPQPALLAAERLLAERARQGLALAPLQDFLQNKTTPPQVAEPLARYGPKKTTLTTPQVDLKALLFTLNRRIERLLDRNHCLGHAYFMELAFAPDPWEALRQLFRDRLLPLLQEYFFATPNQLELVLGRHFSEGDASSESTDDFFAESRFTAPYAWDEQPPFRLKSPDAMSREAFQEAVISIYRR
ncbi:5-methylcytosine-specific restriction enzyme B [Catalinimonas alkaloidigena]|uniref:5-methylcytosine-specific restriction enzyme B n=1 Tax=Catalinimonas alkaloidigena TaxID=1075417 RepID=A0A1G9F7P9_9BACT|nr:AAA family ATPase [Catalinimonas alkaloidigena]SDK84378.1 5-methylcytosine-specific restriction enzyme B [Catalinimonas alkaloidigena]